MGKLIYSNTWYYAAAVAEEEAQRIAGLRQRISAADQGRHRRHCPPRCIPWARRKTARCVVVLSCGNIWRRPLSCGTRRRRSCCTAIRGCVCPPCACGRATTGKLGVYCVQGSFPQFKPVEMVYQGDDYVLVSVPQNTEGLSTLRPGDEVIMTGVTLDGTQILKED